MFYRSQVIWHVTTLREQKCFFPTQAMIDEMIGVLLHLAGFENESKHGSGAAFKIILSNSLWLLW